MPDPKKFKNHYIICAYSARRKQLREQHYSNEMTMKNRPASLSTARNRSIEFAKSLNEIRALSVSDWEPRLYLRTESSRIPVPID